MSQQNYQDKLRKSNKGTSLQDAPFMVLLSAILITFVTVLGIYLGTNFLEIQKHATAVDAAQKIYNAADLLSAGTAGSTRTIWVNLPAGYTIDFYTGNISLRMNGEKIGDMGIKGIKFTGNPLTRPGKYHLLISFSVDYFGNSKIKVSEIT